MTEDELLELIAGYEKTALGASAASGPNLSGNTQPLQSSMTTLEVDRYNALNAYYARPLGNEIEDRSAVVMPELRDTVEWVMPQLMRMFAAGPPVQFDPVGQNDEKQAEIETQVVNHVFMKQNPGFFILHDMFKDALLLRNGYTNAYYEERRTVKVESYTGLTQIEVTKLFETEDKMDVLEQEERKALIVDPATGMPSVAPMFDLKLRRTSKAGRICVEAIPVEEMLVAASARGSFDDDLPFAEHCTQVSRSRLIERGFDKAKVESIEKARPTWQNLIAIARNEVTDQMGDDDVKDKASQQVTVRTAFVRCDYDGDGVSELRCVVIGGDKILDNYEAEEISFSGAAPIRMPHRHTGISYYDILYDLQVIKSTLWRQGLDNLYSTNNRTLAVDVNKVNVDDLLISRPGGIRRVNGAPGEALMEMGGDSNVMSQIMPAMDYLDLQREMRTGIGKDTMGVDADALQDVTKGGQLAAMSAAAMKVELVARLLAEGVKETFNKIHRLLIRHQDKPMTMQIAGKWVDVNPASWRERTAVTPNVGLGSGNRQEQRTNVVMLQQLQEKLAPTVSSPFYRYSHATFVQACRLLGFENPEKYAPDPDDPQVLQMQHKAQSQQPPELQKITLDHQADLAEIDAKTKSKQAEIAANSQAQAQNDAREQQRIAAEAAADERRHQGEAMLEQFRAMMAQQSEAAKQQMTGMKAELDATVKLIVAQISATKGADTDTGAGDTNQALAAALMGVQDALGALRGPRTVTLPDGRQMTVQ
jgi:hypothetical protein